MGKCQKFAKSSCRPTFSQRNKTLKNIPLCNFQRFKIHNLYCRIRDLFENNVRSLLEDRSTHFKINIAVENVWNFQAKLSQEHALSFMDFRIKKQKNKKIKSTFKTYSPPEPCKKKVFTYICSVIFKLSLKKNKRISKLICH